MEQKNLPMLKEIARRALQEDAARADITSQILFDSKERATAEIIAKEEGVLCGAESAKLVFEMGDPHCKVKIHEKDGKRLEMGQKIMTISGNLQKLLACERTALNFLQHLSGVATLTAKFVAAVQGTKVQIYDTRKTIPGFRILQKWAVVCGGGKNHRMHLTEMAMVKDNHLKMLRSKPELLLELKSKLPKNTRLVIEAKTHLEVELALKANADIILLDNMSLRELKREILNIRSQKPSTQIEISGGIGLDSVKKMAHLDIDRISVGKLTHSAPALDISLELE